MKDNALLKVIFVKMGQIKRLTYPVADLKTLEIWIYPLASLYEGSFLQLIHLWYGFTLFKSHTAFSVRWCATLGRLNTMLKKQKTKKNPIKGSALVSV